MLKYSFALCVDPESTRYYSINLSNYSIRMEECSEKQLQEEFKKKAENACADLKYIVSWEAFDYGVTKRTDFYRRRRLPEYLLQDTKLKFPSYIIQQALPRAITIETVLDENTGEKKEVQKFQIDAEIYILQYFDLIKVKEPFASEPSRTIPKVFSCKLRLPNPVNEIIKVIIKTALQKQDIELTTRKSNHQFVLKVYGSENYLYGNTAFMKYQYVRKCLRNKEPAKLQLTEKKFKENSKFRAIVFERNRKQVDQGIYKQVKWSQLRNQQPFLWYPPSKLTHQYISDLKDKEELTKRYIIEKSKVKQKQKEGILINRTAEMEKLQHKLQKYGQQQKFQIPRLILKQHMIKVMEEKINTSHKVIEIESKLILSGECQFSLDIKLAGIYKFKNILKHSSKHQNHPKSLFEVKSCFSTNKKIKLAIAVRFTYGDQIFKQEEFSPIAASDSIVLDKKVSWEKLSCLPLETKLFIQILAHTVDSKQTLHLGTASFNLFDQKGYLLAGQQRTNIWPFFKPDRRIAGCIGSYQKGFKLEQSEYSEMVLQFPRFINKVRWSLRSPQMLHNLGYSFINVPKNNPKPKIEEISRLDSLLAKDPLKMTQYSDEEKRILKICHSNYSKNPEKYMNFLYSIDWSDPNDVYKAIHAREMLNKEKEQTVKSTHYIGVFSSRLVDEAIRLHAVDKLIAVSDDEIMQYVPQLVQSLLMESIHHNSLSEFLLQRAVLSPFTIGQALFWELRSQLHKELEFERYAVYLECLAMCSVIRKSLVSQIETNNVLKGVSQRVLEFKDESAAGKNQYFQTYEIPEMRNLLPIPFILAINPEKQNDDFLDAQCKVFSSKKKPLLLTLIENPTRRKSMTDSPKKRQKKFDPIVLQRIIFKNGDDIHQDQLTLQILNIMDNIWLQQGLDLKMSLYRVLPVADMIGFIEVVGDSKSCSGIHKQNDPNGALKKQTYDNYLVKHNPEPEQYVKAVDNFIRSVAGYLVASYVLGLGDRHSDNVMVTKSGKFFHIDFGHFLGNFKSKFGINRERSPFLFTSLFKYVIDKNKSWDYFIKLCGRAYNQIRKNANFIIQMFMLMTAAGIPELYQQSNIQYLVDKLSLELSKPEAEEKIRKEIDDALDIEYVKNYDNLIHDLKHG